MRRAGVTAIEVAMVIVILLLLAAIAYPRIAGNQQRRLAYDARTSLEKLRDAQDAYYAQHRQYATDLTTTKFTPPLSLPSDVTVTISGTGMDSGRGWAATSVVTQAPTIRCYIGVGVDTVVGTVHLKDGSVTCP